MNTMYPLSMLSLAVAVLLGCSPAEKPPTDYDVCVYGGTPAGVVAARAAADRGLSVLLLEQTEHLGGMNSSGLLNAETAHLIDDGITGLARQFYIDINETFYTEEFCDQLAIPEKRRVPAGEPMFMYFSSQFEAICDQWVDRPEITIQFNAWVDSVAKNGTDIRSITLTDGQAVSAKVFVDCTYEGDLMARAGVSYTYGRESIATYGESLAGVRIIDDTLSAQTVDDQGNLLPWFNRYDSIEVGSADRRVLNYNFRPTLTTVDSNKVAVYPPEGYSPDDYSLLADFLAANPDTKLHHLIGKYRRHGYMYEFNNQQNSLISMGMFGANLDYPDGDYATRAAITKEHEKWAKGLLYFLATDPRHSQALRDEMNRYGYAKSEFVDNNHFPYYLYVREARRMQGPLVMTQKDIFEQRHKPDAVFLASHWIDAHHVQRIALSDSTFVNEGRIWEIVHLPYEISYRILTPKAEECTNLLVPVCASLSHVANCSYRMEPSWMQAGHVAAVAAKLAIDGGVAVQEVDYATLKEQLEADGMVTKIGDLGPYDDYVDHATKGESRGVYGRMYPDSLKP